MGDGYQEVQEVISIHAPTRGATSLKATEYKLSIDFNPRSHERSDNYIPDEFKSYIISIHAPTRGATFASIANYVLTGEFQSTLPREERLSVQLRMRTWKRFQSTLPREERHRQCSFSHLHTYFNPRSHERSDWIHHTCSSSINAISIHAPTRGATVVVSIFSFIEIFQSTLPREERLFQYAVRQL